MNVSDYQYYSKSFTMRVILTCLLITTLTATFSVNASPRLYNSALHDDLEDFLSLVPKDEILSIFLEYVEKDKEVQYVLEYIQTSEFRELVKDTESIPDVINFYKYLQDSGLDVYYLVNKLHDVIGLPPLSPLKKSVFRITGGISGLIADIKNVLPISDIKLLYHEKMVTSAAFKKLIENLKSPKFQAVVDTLLKNAKFQEIVKKAKAVGVDIKAITDLLATIFGLEFPKNTIIRMPRELHDDLQDFLALMPVDKIKNIFLDYVTNDEEVQYVIEYVQTAEFRELVKAIESIPDVVTFYKYLQESGLDVYYLVNKLHDFIGLPPLVPKNARIPSTRGVAGLIADIKAVLPINDIKALYNEKLETSVEFKQLIERLQSPKFQAVVDTLLANAVFQEIVEQAKAVGVDIKAITDLLATIFGLEFPKNTIIRMPRELHDDLQDFLALMPVDKIKNIFLDYVTNDEEVQYVIEYVQTAEFRELVKAIESIPDVVTFYKYLQESGLDVYYLVNKLHDFIGLPPLVPKNARIPSTRGVAGLIADIKAVLPINDIKALYNEKLETSVEFKQLIERLQSPKFQAVVDTLLANAVFQEIVEQAKAVGVDIKAITDLLATIFGLEFPKNTIIRMPRELHDDLQDFLALMPVDKIKNIFLDYVTNDEEVQYVIEYVQTAEFRELVKAIESIPDVVTFYKYLQESGLDVYYLVNKLHDFIGLPPLVPKNARIPSTRGVVGLIADIKAVLPINDIKALYNEKLETSVEFKQLIERLQSPKFQAVVDALLANAVFQEIVEKAKAVGVDIKAITDLLFTIFGLEFPRNQTAKEQANSFDIAFIINVIKSDLHIHDSQLSIRGLKDDVLDFILLIPIEKVAKITVKYIINDAEVQEAIKYIESQELEDLVVKLQKDQEVYELLMYFVDSGADIISVINILNEFLDFPPYPTKFNRDNAVTHGVQGMLEEIRMVLPYDEIKIMYNKKLEESREFRYFIECIKDPAFQKIVDKIVVNKNVLELGYQAELHGINIDVMVKFLSEVFGLNLPDPPYFPPSSYYFKREHSLSDEFADFYDLLPIEDIIDLAIQYAMEDKEMQEVIAYIHSQSFKNIISALHEIPEYKQILKELEAQGLDVNSIIAKLQELIGFGDVYSSLYQGPNEKPGLAGFIELVKEMLPYKQIKALYEEKMKTSEPFIKFIELISSKEFQAVTDKLFHNKDFQFLLNEANDHGVDLKAISDFFLRVFGIETPPGIINYH